jgi:hypothetical protein
MRHSNIGGIVDTVFTRPLRPAAGRSFPYQADAVPPLRESTGIVIIVAIVLLMFPTILWIFRAEWVWPWDEAYYAELALKIYHAAEKGILPWFRALFVVPDSRAPLLPWLAQATTPLIGVLGSPERALMLTNVGASGVTLWLVYSQARRFGAGLLVALAGMLACASSPSFVAFNNLFLVETVQMMSITGMAWLAFQADRLSTLRLISAAGIWTSIGMLAKTTSPAFELPLLLYVVIARFATRGCARAPGKASDYGLAIIAMLISAATILWYAMHWSLIMAHVLEATNSDVALLYGSIKPFFTKFAFWWRQLMWSLTPSAWAGALIILLAVLGPSLALAHQVRYLTGDRLRVAVQSGLLFFMCLMGTTLAVLVVCSKSIEEDPRFIAPLVPLIAMLVSGSLTLVGRSWLAGCAAAGLTANWVAVQLAAQGVLLFPWGTPGWLQAPLVDLHAIERLTRAVHVTCDKSRAGHLSIIGADLLNFSSVSAWLYAEKMQGELGYRCNYTSLGYAEKDVNRAINRLYDADADYFVTLPLDKLPPPEADVFNRVARPVAAWIAMSPDFERVSLNGDELVVYKRRR